MSQRLVEFVDVYGAGEKCKLEGRVWVGKLIIKLLEITHSQWILRNLVVHDTTSGTMVTRDKEELQQEIEYQCELGSEGLAEGDKWMMEVDLENLDNTSGESQFYWLVAIHTAREAFQLSHGPMNQNCRSGIIHTGEEIP